MTDTEQLKALADAEPVNRCITELLAFAKDHPGTYIFPSWDGSRVMKYLATSPQAAQTEGKPIEALAPTEAQEHPAYPEGDVGGPCVCGSWPGGKCLRCEWLTEADKLLQQALEALEYRLQQTRPIHQADSVMEAIRTYLENKA